jgi:predicted  nucleic acid-binding Zn-ribbon protein
VTIKDQLRRLVRIQELAMRTRRARELVESAPRRLEEIEQRFRERNAEYVAVRERFEALEADQRHRSGELSDLEEHRKKYMDDLMQVTNQREYAAMLREIDTVKAQISLHETAILHDLEEIETVKGDLAAQEEHIREERNRVDVERAQVETDASRAREEIEQLVAERKAIEAALPPGVIAAVERLEAGRAGQFLSETQGGVCQSCFVRMRPQVFQEIRQATRIHTCSNCRRILVHGPSLEPPAEDGASKPSDSENNVEVTP